MITATPTRYDRAMARISSLGGLILTALFFFALMVTESLR